MPKDLTVLFKEESAKEEQSPLHHLFTLEIPDVPDFYFCDSNEDLVYNSITYIKFPCKFSGIEVLGDGSIQKASLTVANADRTIEALIEQYNGLRGYTLRVKTVYDKFLDNGSSPSLSSHTEEVFMIDSFSANEAAAQFSLEPNINFNVKAPRRKYTCSCSFKYKDPDTCQYAGELPSCRKDLADCRAHGNQINFGGVPSISVSTVRRIYF